MGDTQLSNQKPQHFPSSRNFATQVTKLEMVTCSGDLKQWVTRVHTYSIVSEWQGTPNTSYGSSFFGKEFRALWMRFVKKR